MFFAPIFVTKVMIFLNSVAFYIAKIANISFFLIICYLVCNVYIAIDNFTNF